MPLWHMPICLLRTCLKISAVSFLASNSMLDKLRRRAGISCELYISCNIWWTSLKEYEEVIIRPETTEPGWYHFVGQCHNCWTEETRCWTSIYSHRLGPSRPSYYQLRHNQTFPNLSNYLLDFLQPLQETWRTFQIMAFYSNLQ